MKKPSQYELKKWLVNNHIAGLRIYYYQTGVDTADTDWELILTDGTKKRMKRHLVEPLVNIDPNWVSVLRPKDEVYKEVDQWEKFAKKEKRDLTEYNRLKKKFE